MNTNRVDFCNTILESPEVCQIWNRYRSNAQQKDFVHSIDRLYKEYRKNPKISMNSTRQDLQRNRRKPSLSETMKFNPQKQSEHYQLFNEESPRNNNFAKIKKLDKSILLENTWPSKFDEWLDSSTNTSSKNTFSTNHTKNTLSTNNTKNTLSTNNTKNTIQSSSTKYSRDFYPTYQRRDYKFHKHGRSANQPTMIPWKYFKNRYNIFDKSTYPSDKTWMTTNSLDFTHGKKIEKISDVDKFSRSLEALRRMDTFKSSYAKDFNYSENLNHWVPGTTRPLLSKQSLLESKIPLGTINQTLKKSRPSFNTSRSSRNSDRIMDDSQKINRYLVVSENLPSQSARDKDPQSTRHILGKNLYEDLLSHRSCEISSKHSSRRSYKHSKSSKKSSLKNSLSSSIPQSLSIPALDFSTVKPIID